MLGEIVYVKKLKSFSGNAEIELGLLAFIILLTIMIWGLEEYLYRILLKRFQDFCNSSPKAGFV